jgi:hypothetical protein
METCETCKLNGGFLYPIYPPHEQSRRFHAGEVTHKLPKDMNRHERRAARKIQHIWCGEHEEKRDGD